MRIVSLALTFCLLIGSQALAISPINLEVIKEAQLYGTANVKKEYTSFLAPWMAFEERAPKLDEFAERAYLYTPFLLIAIDARGKAQQGKQVETADSSKTLENYSGYVIFSATLYGGNDALMQNAAVTVKQDKRTVKAAQSTVEVSKTNWPDNKPQYMAQCYFYFQEKDIQTDKPALLHILTADKQEHTFYFNMDRIK